MGQGATGQTFSLVGSNFQTGINVAFSGTGINVNWIARQTANQVWINVDIAGNAPLGARDVTITNPDGGTVVMTSAVTVTARPTITSLSPNSKGRGTSAQNITLTGTGFGGSNGTFGGSVSFSGNGINVISVTRNSSTSLTVRVSVSSGASTGFRGVTVTNPDQGSFTLNNGFRIT
jgi:hypothetical protein